MTVRPEIPLHDAPTTVENAEITVVGGAGHVGIPLSCQRWRSRTRVNVNDLNQQLLDVIEDGRLQFIDYQAEGCLSQALGHGQHRSSSF